MESGSAALSASASAGAAAGVASAVVSEGASDGVLSEPGAAEDAALLPQPENAQSIMVNDSSNERNFFIHLSFFHGFVEKAYGFSTTIVL